MARNSSGTYQRIGNSFTAPTLGTTIDPGDAEAFWDELDSEITDSLSRSGKGGMLADLDMNEHAILSAASIGLADTDASHTLTIGAGSNLTAGRTLTLTTGDADRTWSVLGNLTIGGNLTLGASFTTSGGHGLTLTTTSITNVTLPVSGTLATLAGSETLSNKTMSGASNTFANLGTSAFSDDAVTNAKLANMGEATIKGRNAGVGIGDPTDLSGTTVTAILNSFVDDSGSGGIKGLVPAPAAGDFAANKFLSAGGAWSIPSGAGDVAGPAGVTDNTVALFNGITGKAIKAGREVLLTDRIYWVRTDGNDSNTGLSDSAGAAFLTWQGAYDAIVAAVDFNGNTVTIRAGGSGARTFAPGSGIRVLTIGGWIGGGALTITGDATTPTNVLLSSTAADAIRITGVCPGNVTINALELRTTTGGYCINNAGHARVLLGSNLVFGATANAHIATTWRTATIEAQATGGNCYKITGGGAGSRHIDCDAGLIQLNPGTYIVSSTPAFSIFARTRNHGCLISDAMWSGSATGQRFQANDNSLMQAQSSDLNHFPGDSAGTASGGGVYVSSTTLHGVASASTTATGVVELATDTEAQALADTTRALTASNLTALLATQANMEAATATDRFVTPGRQRFHPGNAKAWALVTFSAGAPSAAVSYNVSSVSETGVGDTTVNLTTAFSGGNYAAVASNHDTADGRGLRVLLASSNAIRIVSRDNAGANQDYNYSVVAFGDLA